MTLQSSQTGHRRGTLESWHVGLGLLLLVAGYLSIAVSQIALGLALVLFLVRWRSGELPFPRTGLEKTAAVLALWALFTIPFSGDVGQSVVFYRRFYLFTALWVMAGLAVDGRRRLWLAVALVGGALTTSLYAQITTLVAGESFFRHRLADISNPMTSGILLMIPLLLTAGFLLERDLARRTKICFAVAALSIALGLLQTLTRSAMLGFVVGLAVMLLIGRRRWFLVLLLVCIVGLGAILVWGEQLLPAHLWQRLDPAYFVSGNNTSVRFEMWRGGWEILKANPWVGVGDHDLTLLSSRYYGDETTVYFGHLHSNLAQMAAIWGVPGLLSGLIFLLAPGWLLLKRLRSLQADAAPLQIGWVLGGVGVWVGFFVAGLTEWYFGDAEAMLIYLSVLGIALTPLRRPG